MVARIDCQFELLRTDIREMRNEFRGGFRGINDRIDQTNVRIDNTSAKIERRIDDTRRDMFHGAIAIFGSLVAVLAVLLAQTL